MAETAGPLNLADADLSGIEALEPSSYNAVVHEVSMDAVKNTSGEGKLPKGTPMVKFQFRITDDINGSTNRRVFSQYMIPPKDYDKEKAARMKGMLVRTLIALGDKEEDVKNAKFSPDWEDYVGRECVVVVGRDPKKTRDSSGTLVTVEGEFNNPVKGVKPAGSITGGDTGGLL